LQKKIQWVSGIFFQEANRLGLETDSSLLSGAEVKVHGAITQLPHTLIYRGIGL
jgi:hypothetical protein